MFDGMFDGPSIEQLDEAYEQATERIADVTEKFLGDNPTDEAARNVIQTYRQQLDYHVSEMRAALESDDPTDASRRPNPMVGKLSFHLFESATAAFARLMHKHACAGSKRW
jgi:hypothetical protein